MQPKGNRREEGKWRRKRGRESAEECGIEAADCPVVRLTFVAWSVSTTAEHFPTTGSTDDDRYGGARVHGPREDALFLSSPLLHAPLLRELLLFFGWVNAPIKVRLFRFLWILGEKRTR